MGLFKTFPVFLSILITLGILWTPTPSEALKIDTSSDLILDDYTKKISMDFKDAQLTDVLKLFSQQSGLNFIAGTDVANKTITLYLDRVPVEQALERILMANGLTYELKPASNIFVVKKSYQNEKDLTTRVYRLRYATVPSSKLNRTLSESTSTASTGDGPSTSSSSSSSDSDEEGASIITAIESVITPDGAVIEDPRTNSLIVTDHPDQFPKIEQTIARLDVRIPQVLIEAEMLDIAKETADLIGVKYSDTLFAYSGPDRGTLHPFDQQNALDDGFQFSDPAQYSAGQYGFSGLRATLQFLRTQTDTKSLARPRILTLNNETAQINIKTDEAIGLASNTTSTEGTASTTNEAERVETGVFLRVTPQVNTTTGEITMAIEPRVVQATQGDTFGGQSFKDPEERATKSVLRIRDGDTIIIGGLLRNETLDIDTKLPFLGDIPILGAPFRHKDKVNSQRELIVFITPHIVRDDDELAAITKATEMTDTPFLREQDVPSKRFEAIQKDLKKFDHQEKK